MEPAELLVEVFRAGIAAVEADRCLPQHLQLEPIAGRTALIAVGKAAGEMARVAVAHLAIDAGVVVIPPGHMPATWRPPENFDVIVGGHPTPNAQSVRAGEAALALAASLLAGDRLIALISGGGSALMAAPVDGVTLADKQALTRLLLASGAAIAEFNAVRASLSRVKGGRLAVAAGMAKVLTYVISDVPGDDPTRVASGPTLRSDVIINPFTVLDRYKIAATPAVRNALYIGQPPLQPQTASSTCAIVCARAADALAAIASELARQGYRPILLGDALEGDAELLARQHAQLARYHAARNDRVALISGGETTVRVTNAHGRGGRNTAYALALAVALDSAPDVFALAADSDGIDGNSPAAGAIVRPETLTAIGGVGAAQRYLDDNNTHAAFAKVGALLFTGPTRTNVNDIRIILISAQAV